MAPLQAGATEVATWLRTEAAALGPFLSTVLLLMAELASTEASPLQPWLAALPDTHDCVLAWSAEERAALDGTQPAACTHTADMPVCTAVSRTSHS